MPIPKLLVVSLVALLALPVRAVLWTASTADAVATAPAGTAAVAGDIGPLAPATELAPPAPEGSGMYSLAAAPNGDVHLVWIEPLTARGGHALRASRLRSGAWSAPTTIAEGSNWFVNWADHPSIAVLGDGSLVAHWLVHNAQRDSHYAYGIRIARSTDGGTSWTEIYKAGTDLTSGYAGFVTLLPLAQGFGAAYLRPPLGAAPSAASANEHDEDHVQTMRYARFARDGSLVSDELLDADACSCCPTDAAVTPDGPAIVYRDHREPVRDISIVRASGKGWTKPTSVHADEWAIPACPTNGPSIDVSGARAAIAWFTAAGDVPRVNVAFSTDGTRTFGAPVRVDGGNPVGWSGVVLLDDGSAVASWLESKGGGVGEIRLRRVRADGGLDAPVVVATAPAARSAGVPQLVRAGRRLVVAWRTDRVRVAAIDLTSVAAAPRPSGQP